MTEQKMLDAVEQHGPVHERRMSEPILIVGFSGYEDRGHLGLRFSDSNAALRLLKDEVRQHREKE